MSPNAPYRPPVDVMPPDISAFKQGNTGIEYVTTFDSGRDGPHLLVNALTHGNEICGAHALCFLFAQQVRPRRGKLTLSFANFRAFGNFDPAAPVASRFVDEDFNRLWTDEVLDGPRKNWELERARALRPLVAEADHLLDLHSMHFPSPALMLTGLREKCRRLAEAVGFPRYIVMDEGHRAGRRMRDYNAFDDPASRKTSLLVECGQHWAEASVQVARATTLHFLRRFEVVSAEFLREHLPPETLEPPAESPEPPECQITVEVTEAVTVSGGEFLFEEEYRGFEVIETAGTLIARDGAEEIRTPYDNCVLVMPSPGNGSKPGLTAVRLGRLVG